jgi:polyisoprenoid-binding protein YceI
MTRQQRLGAGGLVLLAGVLFAGHLAGASPASTRSPSKGQLHVIDQTSSRLSVQTQTSGLSSLFGHDHRFDAEAFAGRLELDLARPHRSRLEVTVQAALLRLREEVTPPVRQEIEETVRAKVLEAARFPTIVFQSHKVTARRLDHETFTVTVRGELRLHGVSRPVAIPARVTVSAGKIRAVGSFTVRQTDFAIQPLTFGGGVTVANEVKIAFDLVAPASQQAGNAAASAPDARLTTF